MTRAKDISKILTDADISGTLDVSGAFTSQGIDDNADATAITIDSSERVMIGNTTEGVAGADELTVGNTSAGNGITIRSGTSNSGALYFSDGTSGASEYDGGFEYSHGSQFMRFISAGSERMRLDSSGRLLLGTTTEGEASADNFTVSGSGNVGMTIRSTNSSETAIYFSDGTSGDDEFRGFINYKHSDNTMRFGTDATDVMRIDSSGNVGIGQTSNLARLTVNSGATNASATFISSDAGAYIGFADNSTTLDSGTFPYVFTGAVGNDYIIGTNNSERMRIEAGGNLLIGSTSYSSSSNNKMIEGNGGVFFARAVTSSAGQLTLANPNGNVGQIRTSGSTTTYATSSDYRLKDNINYTFDATSQIKQLKPCEFNFKTDLTTKIIGFIAHETQEIVPQAVSGTKDQVDADGNIDPQGIDNSHLVPLLVKTIQELESRITALEGA